MSMSPREDGIDSCTAIITRGNHLYPAGGTMEENLKEFVTQYKCGLQNVMCGVHSAHCHVDLSVTHN